ncbi:MAG: hypothetical protein N3G76_02185 [Candidatus Micrarchaeota archaeon]|nr:hypothetical protein [Candidatus Micrarchaeota archaeon]
MKNMQMCLALLFLIAASAAADTFTVSIRGIDGARGRLVSGDTVLDIGNCDMPLVAQNTVMALRMNYPSTCTGQMDVYYSYYDFSTGTYTDEVFACSISGDENCKLTFNIWFGGKGSGTEDLSKWATFRAVCRKSQAQYTYDLPLKIVHTETQFEKKLMPKVNDAEKSVGNAKAALAACPCCAEKGYADMVRDYETQLNALKLRVAQCSFQNIENQFIDLKNSADNAAAQMGAIKCEQKEEKPVEAGGSSEEAQPQQDIKEENYSSAAKPSGGTQGSGSGIQLPGAEGLPKPSGGLCPAMAVLMAVLGGLAAARARA